MPHGNFMHTATGKNGWRKTIAAKIYPFSHLFFLSFLGDDELPFSRKASEAAVRGVGGSDLEGHLPCLVVCNFLFFIPAMHFLKLKTAFVGFFFKEKARWRTNWVRAFRKVIRLHPTEAADIRKSP